MAESLPEMAQMEATLVASLRARFDLRFSLIELLRRNAANAPDRPAILEPNRASLTHQGLLQLAEKTVQTLNALGLSRRSRVAVALDTTAEAASVYACVMAGMTVIPLSPTLPADEYERYLQHTHADALLVQHETAPAARLAAQRLALPLIEALFPADGPVGLFGIMGPGGLPDAAAHFARPDDIAVILLTSGTTTLPKLVPWSQRELSIVSHFALDVFHVAGTASYPILILMPLQHLAGLFGVVRSVCWQSGLACAPSNNIGEIYRYLALYRPASIYASPALLGALVDEAPAHAAQLAQIQLQKITSISAAVTEKLLRDLQHVFRCPVQLHYGMTEMQTVACDTPEPNAAYQPGYVGQPHIFCALKIAAEDGAALAANQTGEIMVRSPRAFRSYLDDPLANAAAFQDGWFRTGDSGHLDEAGRLFITGRLKEMINRGGNKIAPAEVDAVLLEHPAVLEAATFSFSHAFYGEDIAAAIVLRDPGVSERELRSFAARHLALYKVPSRFVFVEAIPKTALGKIKRAALAEQFGAQLER